MNIIKTEIWEQHPEIEGCLRYVKQRKASEVFSELESFLKREQIYPDDYFLIALNYNNPECDFPKFDDMMCYAQWGGSEGIYLEVELFLYDEQTETSHRSVFASGKSLGESTEDFERMQYIAAQIYMAFMGHRFQSGRYVVADKSSKKNRKTLLEKVNFEFKDYINHKLLREKLPPSKIAEKLGMMAIILDTIVKADFSDDKVVELIEKKDVLSSLCKLCNKSLNDTLNNMQETIEQTLLSCQSFANITYSVQMVSDNYDVIHNPKVRELYPNLYSEVCEHDEKSLSTWYKLSENAFDEYELYTANEEIGYYK